MTEVTFKESLLIPMSYFKKRQKTSFEKEKSKLSVPVTAESILLDKTIPADLRVKYFDNLKKFDKARPPAPINVITTTEKKEEGEKGKQREEDLKIILNDMPDSKKPLASSIINFMRETKDITWNSQFEVAVDERIIPNSDIRKILQFLVGEVIYTSGKLDIPKGAATVKEKLEILEVPPSWLKHVPRSSKRKQRGQGIKWIVY